MPNLRIPDLWTKGFSAPFARLKTAVLFYLRSAVPLP